MKTLFTLFGTLLLILFASGVNAQTIYSANNQENTVPSLTITDVHNTGNDVKPIGNGIMQVMVTDGSTHPSFAWDDTDAPSSGKKDIVASNDDNVSDISSITDPDVIVIRDDAKEAIVVFEYQGDVYYNHLRYNGSNAWSWVGSVSLGSGHNPNIDADVEDYIVITWEDDGNIEAVAGTYQGNGSFSFSSTVTVNNSGEAYYPDVTVYENNSTRTVSFTYLEGTITTAGDHDLYVDQEEFSDVSGNSMSNSPTSLYSAGSTELLGRPRIASPDTFDNSLYTYHDDYTITVGLATTDMAVTVYDILAFNQNKGSTNSVNCSDDYPNDLHKDPAVTYSGDLVIVAWTTDCDNNREDIIARQLYYDGSLATSYYSIANYLVTNDQNTVSVSGRNDGLDVLYTWFDDNNSEISYKTASSSSQYLRIGRDEIDVAIWYDQGIGSINVENGTSGHIQIFDMNGRLIASHQIPAGHFVLTDLHLPSGVYIITFDNGVEFAMEKLFIS